MRTGHRETGQTELREVESRAETEAGILSQEDPWEAAYLRFETPEQEIRKFVRRLVKTGAAKWPRDSQIVELFCGRGNGLHALERLGFTHLEGADLSSRLLNHYKGAAKLYVCDCRKLPFPGRSRHAVIVQGGLHHLPRLPDDLEQVLAEMHRVLRKNGCVLIVEPWLTPFLRLVHAACKSSFARRVSSKLDAMATMIEHERPTYERWLHQADLIRGLARAHFSPLMESFAWGKWNFAGVPL